MNNTQDKSDSLRDWILTHQHQILLSSDSVIQDYKKANHLDSNWISSSIAVTKYALTILGSLAVKAGDSSDCVVVELTFYRDATKKRSIMMAATDSTCLNSLANNSLNTDSTNDFIYGQRRELIE